MTCEKYFCASNSSKGFVSYFPNIFNKLSCKRIYVIKGGPGTGKSRFMKDVAQEAEKRGLGVKYYFCSSDPDSLDGIVVEGVGGFLDGTYPHVYEPCAIGAFEENVDLGAFWNKRVLMENRVEIELLSKCKSQAYMCAYDVLSAQGRILEAIERIISPCVDRQKLSSAVKRLLHKLPKGSGAPEIGLCRSLGMSGDVRFDTYERASKMLFSIPDYYHTAHVVLGEIKRQAVLQGIPVRYSPDPLLTDRIDALCLLGTDMGFTVSENGERIINPRRFIVESAIKSEKEKIKKLDAEAKRLSVLSFVFFNEVRDYHFALEEIYTSAMDFERKESFTKEFIKNLF